MNMEMIRQEKIRNNDELSDTEMSSELPEISLNVKVRKPKNSLHLQVKNMNCEWIGMGIGWASWAGKNIVPALEHAAIEFYARVDGNPIYNFAYCFYFRRLFIQTMLCNCKLFRNRGWCNWKRMDKNYYPTLHFFI